MWIIMFIIFCEVYRHYSPYCIFIKIWWTLHFSYAYSTVSSFPVGLLASLMTCSVKSPMSFVVFSYFLSLNSWAQKHGTTWLAFCVPINIAILMEISRTIYWNYIMPTDNTLNMVVLAKVNQKTMLKNVY